MSKLFKIGLIGTPGSGRTTVAVQLSERLQLPFLTSKSVTQKILDRDGFDYMSGMYVENFLAEKSREKELIDSKIKSEKDAKGFITDRTTLEQFAYALLVVEQYSDEEILKLQDKCRKHLGIYTHLFYFPRAFTIKKNGVRTTNKFFQMKMDFIIKGLLSEWNVKFIENANDLETILPHIS